MNYIFLLFLIFFPVSLCAQTLYVNPSKSTNLRKEVFRTVNEALRQAEKISQEKKLKGDTTWTTVSIAPSVYWIDDPNKQDIARPLQGENTPYGMKLKLDRVKIIGESSNPKDVILACQRGQTQGADGNFTMFHITGSDIEVENVTFGNYCNVDLVYPKNHKLNRPRRADAIVQAQLVICDGDRYHARNCEDRKSVV